MPGDPLLSVQGLYKSYRSPEGPELQVLKGLNLSVDRGETLAVSGPSGCGKSTLLNLIGTLDTPDAGMILFDGDDLNELSETQAADFRNQKIGFIFQLHHLLPQCTALENVLMPALASGTSTRTETVDRAKTLLKQVGLENRLTYRPGQLSGGECQRVAVVRALINRPALLLADEPTGALDQDTSAELISLLYDLQKSEGLAMILVTHSSELAATASRQLLLDNGIFETT